MRQTLPAGVLTLTVIYPLRAGDADVPDHRQRTGIPGGGVKWMYAIEAALSLTLFIRWAPLG